MQLVIADCALQNRNMSLFAELERRKKAEETYAHQQQNALAGFSNGGLLPYGYLRKESDFRSDIMSDPSRTFHLLDREEFNANASPAKVIGPLF